MLPHRDMASLGAFEGMIMAVVTPSPRGTNMESRMRRNLHENIVEGNLVRAHKVIKK